MKTFTVLILTFCASFAVAQEFQVGGDFFEGAPCTPFMSQTANPGPIEEVRVRHSKSTTTTTVAPDDESNYYTNTNEGYDTRIIYFVHGLGGNDKSWDAVDDAHQNEYIYSPCRPDYEDHQRDFGEASYEVHVEMNRLWSATLQNYGSGRRITSSLPYAIGHSQGGLVLRDMDRRYDDGQYFGGVFQPTARPFFGIVTFGTPHAGAPIAVAQEDLTKLSIDLATKLGHATVMNAAADLTLKYAFLSGRIQKLTNKANLLVQGLSEDFVGSGVMLVSKGQQAPITKQYGTNSAYLKNTLNYSNPKLPKALFYGNEEEPLVYRICTFMIGPGASDQVAYKRFEANSDGEIEKGIKELRAKILADKVNKANELIQINSRHKFLRKHFGLGKTKIMTLNQAVVAFEEAIDVIDKLNLRYKVITGITSLSSKTRKLVGYRCRVETHNYVSYTGGVKKIKKYTYKILKPEDFDKCQNVAIPIYSNAATTQPSDAVLTEYSQKAFPGCLDKYKFPLNEVYVKDNAGKIIGIKYQNNANHIQMLNCAQTEPALVRIYSADGLPQFFKLTKIQK